MINKNIDILKYIMSIMIVILHLEWFLDSPVLRCAVPVFFIISSFLFFNKIKNSSAADSKVALRKLTVRTIKLYLFWFIVLLPITLALHIHIGDLRQYLIYFPLNLILDGVFPASWYFAAYIIGIHIVYHLRNFPVLSLVFGIIGYLICCGVTNYGSFAFAIVDINHLPYILSHYIRNSYMTFLAGLYFIWIGKYIADNNIRNMKVGLTGIVVGSVMLYFENSLVCRLDCRVQDDCYLSLILLAPAIYIFVLSLPQFIGFDTGFFRKASTIYYCSHIPIFTVLLAMEKYLQFEMDKPLTFICVITLCTLLAATLINLSERRRFKILRYSY